MSSKIEATGYRLICDGRGCREVLHLSDRDSNSINFRDVARKQSNWVSTGSWMPRDYCPTCANTR